MYIPAIIFVVSFFFLSPTYAVADFCPEDIQLSFYIQDDDDVLTASLSSGKLSEFIKTKKIKFVPYNRKQEAYITEVDIPKVNIIGYEKIEWNSPYHFNKGSDLLAISIYQPSQYSSESFAIIDVQENQLTNQISVPDNHVILDIKFNKESTALAVVYAQYVIEDNSWFDKFAKNMGHPNNHYNFFSSIYSPDGKLKCSFQLKDEIDKPNVLIVWSDTLKEK